MVGQAVLTYSTSSVSNPTSNARCLTLNSKMNVSLNLSR